MFLVFNNELHDLTQLLETLSLMDELEGFRSPGFVSHCGSRGNGHSANCRTVDDANRKDAVEPARSVRTPLGIAWYVQGLPSGNGCLLLAERIK